MRFITKQALPNLLCLSDVVTAIKEDCVIQCTLEELDFNNWRNQNCSKDNNFRCYQQVGDELASVEIYDRFILLCGTKLCIPESLQHHVVRLAHGVYQGRTKCKVFLRETCWFPYMDRLVEDTCRNCI